MCLLTYLCKEAVVSVFVDLSLQGGSGECV